MTQPVPPQYPNAQPAFGYGGQQAGPPSYGPSGVVQRTKTNVTAIIALIAAFFIPLVAVICGWVALSQIRRTGEQGRGLALAGLILGLIGCVGWILFWVAIAAGGGSFHYEVST